MARGVLIVSTGDKGETACMIEEAFGRIVRRGFYTLACTPADPEFLNLGVMGPNKESPVRQAGEKLYRALVEDHPNVQEFFTHAKQPAKPPVSPVYLRIDTPTPENFPWEILWELQNGFMILDPQGRWPIARLATMAPGKTLHKGIGTSLRLAVVLAAAGEQGTAEWREVSKHFSKVKAPVDLLGLASEDETQDAIRKDAETWASIAPGRNVEIDYPGNDASSLIDRLRAYGPNIIHIFCHGAAGDRPQLQVETRGDRATGKTQGSIKLEDANLQELASLDTLWLVVLNCCQGAKPAPQLHSLAKRLVEAGVPAVVAMRESIDVKYAHIFAEHFYSELFTRLQLVFSMRNISPPPPPDPPIQFPEIAWVEAVCQARLQLSFNRPPDTFAEWTYPVVYVNDETLYLHPRDLKPWLTSEERKELIVKLNMLRAIREPLELAPDGDAMKRRTNIDVEIHDIEAKLAGA